MINTYEKKTRRVYSQEFIAEAVRLVTSGERKQCQVARNLGVASSTISKWCHLSRSNEAISKGTSIGDSERVKFLEAEVKRLKLEQEILKKVAAYFAKNLS